MNALLRVVSWLVILGVVLLSAGCTRAEVIRGAVDVADGMARSAEANRPVLAKQCNEPLAAAVADGKAAEKAGALEKRRGAVAVGRAIEQACDPAMSSQDALLRVHAALRAAIVSLHLNRPVAELPALLLQAATASESAYRAFSALKVP